MIVKIHLFQIFIFTKNLKGLEVKNQDIIDAIMLVWGI